MTESPPDFDQVFRDQVDANPVLHALLVYGKRYRWVLMAGLVTAALTPILNLVPAYLLGVAIDIVAGGRGPGAIPLVSGAWVPTGIRGQLLFLFGLLGATAIASLVVESVDTLVWSWLEHNVEHDLRIDAYESAQLLGMDFFNSAQTGDVMNVLSGDMETFQDTFGGWFKQLFQVVVFGIGMLAVMLAMNWQLAAVILAVGVPFGAITYLFHSRASTKYTSVRRNSGQINAHLETCIDGISAVKANTNEAYERQRIGERSRTFRDSVVDVHTFVAAYAGVRRFLLEGSTLVVLLIGGWVALRGDPTGLFAPVTVGTLITFFFYARRFADQMNDLGRTVNGYDRIAAAGRRVFGLVNYPGKVDEPANPEPVEHFAGRVVYDDVTFRYPGTDEPALRDVSFEVEPGEFVGIVGPTGAGKTTLAKLLVRFYDPDDGSILLDGHDLRDLTLADLRESIGYVQQEPFLFDGTVRENIAYANRDASDRAVVGAAKRAHAHEFIVDLEAGYDTRVGERGVKLSGGQRQRIVIARELLRDPDLLILDEATSHVDNETELLIQDALEALTANRTTFAIAHHLSVARDADTLLVLEDGTLEETGTHEELSTEAGLYATLWRIHVGKIEGVPDDLVTS